MKSIKSILNNHYFLIVLVYLLAHFFMLLLSGCWWDDWTFMSHDLVYINEVASQSGRPEWNILVPLAWSSTNNGRVIIFVLYLFISLFVYKLLDYSKLFNREDCLLITLLFTVLPFNDARILISNFAYTVGLFFFYLAFMLLAKYLNSDSKSVLFRILLLILFFISFILNSILAYYYIVVAYMFVLELKSNNETNIYRRIFGSIKNVLFKYPDFFILPFVYYGYNKIFFPTHGDVFGSYNEVTISGFIKCILYIPISILALVYDTFHKMFSNINLIVLLLLLVMGLYVWYINRFNNDKNTDLNSKINNLIYGLFLIVMALFPYVMVRGTIINTTGVKGRDTILVPLGLAILFVAVCSFMKTKFKRMLLSLLIVLGIISFNMLYIEWQKDFYYQLSLENLLNNEVIKNNDTFFLTDLNESEIKGQRYYSLNWNAYNVFKDQTRLFIPKVSNLYLLSNIKLLNRAKEELNYSHMMRDYNPDDYCIDAVLDYSNNLNWVEVIDLKRDELFDTNSFDKKINNNGSLDIYEVDDDFTKLLLKEYDDGNLKEDDDVLELLKGYKK